MTRYEAEHEFYDNHRPQYPLALTADVRWIVVRTEVVAETYNADKGYQRIVFKHYVERGRG